MKIKLKFLEILFVSFCLILVSSSAIIGLRINNQETNEMIILLSPDVIIPDDYNTIQEGINNANPGNTIFVRSGIYNENLLVNKNGLTIRGENKYNTTISSRDTLKNTIKINASNVTIQDFSIVNSTGTNTLWDTSGIFIAGSNIVVKDNLIYNNNRLGICALNIAYNLTICGNDFTDDGILLGDYEHTGENINVTKECFLHDIYNNTVNGKPLYYFKNVDNFIVPNDAGQVILVNCSNATIKDSYFTLCDFPIMLNYCNNCIVENNTVEDTYGEIITTRSENCTFQNNVVDNIIFGVCLDQKSKNNIIRYNKITNSNAGVFIMIKSNNNSVYGNTFCNNDWGAGLFLNSNNNKIYRNFLRVYFITFK